MEHILKIELVDKNKVKIINPINLSPWTYNICLNNKWYNLFIDSEIIEFPKDISNYFSIIEEYNKDREDNKIDPTIKICLDLIELKKLEKIDKIKIGSDIAPIMPDDRIDKIEKELIQKQKQFIMLNTKLENLENLFKKSLGL